MIQIHIIYIFVYLQVYSRSYWISNKMNDHIMSENNKSKKKRERT